MPIQGIHANMVASVRLPFRRTNDDRTEYNLCLKLEDASIRAVDSILVFCTNERVFRPWQDKSMNAKREKENAQNYYRLKTRTANDHNIIDSGYILHTFK